jgi:hypothetical protein
MMPYFSTRSMDVAMVQVDGNEVAVERTVWPWSCFEQPRTWYEISYTEREAAAQASAFVRGKARIKEGYYDGWILEMQDLNDVVRVALRNADAA